MKISQFLGIIDVVMIAIAFFFPNEVYGLGLAAVNVICGGVYALWCYAEREDKLKGLDEIDMVF